MTGWRIGELARASGCPTETIRYYEREGLLPPPQRTVGNYRVYGEAHKARLAFIRNCRALDMTLEEIRSLLNIRDLARDNCHAAHALLDDHIQHVSARIEELLVLRTQLRAVRRSCSPAGKSHSHCAILDDLGRVKSPLKRRVAHVRGSHKSG